MSKFMTIDNDGKKGGARPYDMLDDLDKVRAKNSNRKSKRKAKVIDKSMTKESSKNLLNNHSSKLIDKDKERASLKGNLTYEECKQLSDTYLLPMKVIYELHSEFNSLLDTHKTLRLHEDASQ